MTIIFLVQCHSSNSRALSLYSSLSFSASLWFNLSLHSEQYNSFELHAYYPISYTIQVYCKLYLISAKVVTLFTGSVTKYIQSLLKVSTGWLISTKSNVSFCCQLFTYLCYYWKLLSFSSQSMHLSQFFQSIKLIFKIIFISTFTKICEKISIVRRL